MSENSSNKVSEKLSALPRRWTWANIDDLCQLIGGGTPARDNPDFFGGRIVWLTPTEIPKNTIVTISDSKEKITESGLHKSSARIIPKGSVLLTSRASIGYVAIAGCDVTTNQGFASFVCESAVFNEYLAYWLFSKKNALEGQATGTTFKEISKTKLRELVFPLPPLAEQYRIVTKIEELLTQLDAGVASLKKVQAQLKRYRQAVLKAAFEGRLTREWREQHKEEIEPADPFLKKISNERKKLVNSTPSTLYAVDTTGLAELPKEWCWASLEVLCDPIRGIPYGVIKLGEPNENGVPTLRSSNVRHLSLDLSDVKKIDHQISELYTRSILKGDEVLVTVRGTLGGVVAVPTMCIGYNISREVALVTLMPKISSKYIAYVIGAPFSQKWMMNRARGIAYIGVNLATLRQLPLPLMSEKEQLVLVNEIERHLSIAEEIENTIKTSLRQAESLRQSILKRAFEGKLVPQDPNDEPASILLERIKAEKARYAAEIKKGKTLQPKSPKRKIKNGN